MANHHPYPSDFLSVILERKRAEVRERSKKAPPAALRHIAEARNDFRPFAGRLSDPGRHGVNIIAEIKRASPSRGPLRADLKASRLAEQYQAGGAAALSVLTDHDFFSGSIADLQEARAATRLPVLRKDFIVSLYQVVEAAAIGADAVLLIVRAVSFEFLRDALQLSSQLGIDALVEVHSEAELDTASRAGARLIGINSRDLTTFRTDLENVIRIHRHLDDDQVAVAESGIHDRRDIERLSPGGIHNFLIGESLVTAPDPAHRLGRLLNIKP